GAGHAAASAICSSSSRPRVAPAAEVPARPTGPDVGERETLVDARRHGARPELTKRLNCLRRHVARVCRTVLRARLEVSLGDARHRAVREPAARVRRLALSVITVALRLPAGATLLHVDASAAPLPGCPCWLPGPTWLPGSTQSPL